MTQDSQTRTFVFFSVDHRQPCDELALSQLGHNSSECVQIQIELASSLTYKLYNMYTEGDLREINVSLNNVTNIVIMLAI